MSIPYLDFELEIGPGDGRDYPLTVLRSPDGEARAQMRWPFDKLALENRLLTLQNALLRSGGPRRRALSKEERAVRDFGRELFELLFTGPVGTRYAVSRRSAERQGAGLRLKLRIQPPELAALPWEFLYDPQHTAYLCLSQHTPVVRYLELAQPIAPLAVQPPLRILGLVASPADLPALDVAVEKERIERAIRLLQEQGLVELHWLAGQSWRDLQRALRRGPWHIFHFVGHGGFDPLHGEGLVMLAGGQGQAQPCTAAQLARLLADHRSLRLALLNACESARTGEQDIFSSTAATLVRAGLPAVLAMQYEITDAAALEFSGVFYEALADGFPVDAALAEARKAISVGVTNSLEWGAPVLFMRTPDGALFALPDAPLPHPPPTPPPTAEPGAPPSLAAPAEPARVEMVEPAPTPTARLSGRQVQALIAALLDAYLGEAALRQFIRIELDENPDTIARGAGLDERIFNLIDWAEQRGRIVEVVAKAHLHRPGSALLRAFAQTVPGVELAPEPEIEPPAPEPAHPIAFDWVTIPAGDFLMGSDKKRDKRAYDDELPQHTLYLPAYHIARVPVTVAQFAAFVEATGYKTTAEERGSARSWTGSKWDEVRGANWAHPRGPESDVRQKQDHPVTCVSWHDTQAFCRWAGVRLPTEAEWEKAARGADGRRWPWGNRWPADRYCNFFRHVGYTTPVGRYPAGASPYGVLDMAGNVWEWTGSRLSTNSGKRLFNYPYDPYDGREKLNVPDTERRILRGGSWYDDPQYVRCTYRYKHDSNRMLGDVGFRVVSPGF